MYDDTSVQLGITIGQMMANIAIIWYMLRQHINKVNQLIKEFNRDRVKIELIGNFLANKYKSFKHQWEAVAEVKFVNGGSNGGSIL